MHWRTMLLTLALGVAGATGPERALAQPPDAAREVAAGGLIFMNHPALVIDSKELVITPSEIRANYMVRNSGSKPVTATVTLPLPDIDAALGNPQSLQISAPESSNFISALFLADDGPVSAEFEQRAMVMGLDVGTVLKAAQLPNNPLARKLPETIARLPAPLKRDLEERGVLRDEGAQYEPNWTLKSTAHWRQVFPPRKVTSFALTYRPLAGSAPYTPDLLDSLRGSHCIDQSMEAELARKLSNAGGKAQLRWLAYQLTSGSAMMTHPIGRFRLQIVTPSLDTFVATCRKGLRRLGPTALEVVISDLNPDEDLAVLFID